MAIFIMNTHFIFVSPFFIISLFSHKFVQFSLPNFDKPLIKIILLTVKTGRFLKPTNVAILLCKLTFSYFKR